LEALRVLSGICRSKSSKMALSYFAYSWGDSTDVPIWVHCLVVALSRL
jgi:hypothetical protein